MARKTIVALYDRVSDAEAARHDLRGGGIPDADIEVLAHSGYGAGNGHGELVPRLGGWGVPRGEAETFAEGVAGGGALLAVSVRKDETVDRALELLRRPVSADLGTPASPPPSGADRAGHSDRALSDAARALHERNASTGGSNPPAGGPGERGVYHDRPVDQERRS